MPSVLIVEDDQLFGAKLREQLLGEGYEVFPDIPPDSVSAWGLIETVMPSVTLIDIHLERRRAGIDLAKRMEEIRLPYILITIDESEAVFREALQLPLVSYLTKPFSIKRLHREIQITLSRYRSDVELRRQTISAKDSSGSPVSVSLFEIESIEAIGNYCYLQCKQQRFSIRSSLSLLKQQLPNAIFLQIHRRYVVNLNSVESVNAGAGLLTVARRELPIGGKYRQGVITLIGP